MHGFHPSQSKIISLKKKNLEIVANFRNVQSGLEPRLMCQFVEKYKKNSSLPNFQDLQNSSKNCLILEIRKIVPRVTKCADSQRNTEKSEFAKFENFWNLQHNLTMTPKTLKYHILNE